MHVYLQRSLPIQLKTSQIPSAASETTECARRAAPCLQAVFRRVPRQRQLLLQRLDLRRSALPSERFFAALIQHRKFTEQ